MDKERVKEILKRFSERAEQEFSEEDSLISYPAHVKEKLEVIYQKLTKVAPINLYQWFEEKRIFPFFEKVLETRYSNVFVTIFNKYQLFWKYRDEYLFDFVFDSPILLETEVDPENRMDSKTFAKVFTEKFRSYFGKAYVWQPNRAGTLYYLKKFFDLPHYSYLDLLCLMDVFFQAVVKKKLNIDPTVQSFVRFTHNQYGIDRLMQIRYDEKLFNFSASTKPVEAMRIFTVLCQFMPKISAYFLTKIIAQVRKAENLSDKIVRTFILLGTCVREVTDSQGKFYIYKGIFIPEEYLKEVG